MRTKLLQTFVLTVAAGFAGCSAENGNPLPIGDETGGSANIAGSSSTGGSTGMGGALHSGGVTSVGGSASTGGTRNTGGTTAVTTGGAPSTGGTTAGGSGNTTSGGKAATGGAATGGTVGGGKSGTGGVAATGGKSGTGGAAATGGKSGTGGSASGGAGTGGSASSCPTTPLSGGTQHCSSNASGNVGSGYSWTIWSSGSGGCVTPYGVGAAFKATWNNSGDFLARVGLALGSNKTIDQFGTFAADFAETKTGTAGGYSYVGIYGWSVDPLHEYYIIDDWFGSRPNPGTKVGSITVDGGTYDILTHTMTNQPAITGGNATFVQFWSLRTTARQCGHISISEHFKAWAGLGLTLGKMEEAKILVEAGGGSGSIDFTLATLTVQ